MNMIEKWIKWNPTDNFNLKYYIDLVRYFSGDLKIYLVSKEKINGEFVTLEFVFDNVYSYRVTNESYCLSSTYFIDKQYLLLSEPKILYSRTFFEVLNSEYMFEFKNMILLKDYKNKIKHYSFVGMEFILDVLSSKMPTFNIISVHNSKILIKK